MGVVVVPVLDDAVECEDVVVVDGFAVCRENGVVVGRAYDYDGWIGDDAGVTCSNYGGRVTSKSFMWSPMAVLMRKVEEAARKVFGSAEYPDEWREFVDKVVEFCRSRKKVGGSFGHAAYHISVKSIVTAWLVYRGLSRGEISREIKRLFGSYADGRTIRSWREFFEGRVTSVWREYNSRTFRRFRRSDWL